MVKNGAKHAAEAESTVKKILITQPRPETEKSPYFDLARRYNVELDFHPFIRLEGIPAKEFRKQKLTSHILQR
jgi:uroporphyrinogen-III synthase